MLSLVLAIALSDTAFRCTVTWKDKAGHEHSFVAHESGPDAPTVEQRIVDRYLENGNGEVSASCQKEPR